MSSGKRDALAREQTGVEMFVGLRMHVHVARTRRQSLRRELYSTTTDMAMSIADDDGAQARRTQRRRRRRGWTKAEMMAVHDGDGDDVFQKHNDGGEKM